MNALPPHPAPTDDPLTHPALMPETVSAVGRLPGNRFAVFATLAAGGAIADLWTKDAVFRWRGLPEQSDTWWLVDGYIGVETAVNIGAVFGLGAGQGIWFATLSVVAALAILVWLFYFRAASDWWLTIAMGCVFGGIIGNLYDRLGLWWTPGLPLEWKSGVRDWILWQAGESYKWPNFNIADSLLVCGAGLLLWRSFFPEDQPAAASHRPGGH